MKRNFSWIFHIFAAVFVGYYVYQCLTNIGNVRTELEYIALGVKCCKGLLWGILWELVVIAINTSRIK